MFKFIRISLGAFLAIAGIVLTVIPGSTLLLLAGLVVLSYDLPWARVWLRSVQKGLHHGARKLDRFLLARKLQ